ncbi:CEL-Activated Resistance 1 [Hibiscus trionum]|uniref:CEL-Activated Resistance 1 n=1 Tax=Hibiscus trionum TaxID=183268 RepID=A0A9W7LHI9_HIBTR|nr:CEL-Activated Resistance 1 [Hibiscus trionum]
MAESIVSTILEQLKEITINKAREAWSLVRGAEKEVERLESNFKALRLELEDAEEREYQDKRVKHWLDKFKDVAYDMEDVLDEWEIAVAKRWG